MIGTNIGIDLGTTAIKIFVEGKGIVLCEPCAAAYEVDTGKLIAVGKRAHDMHEKAPDAIRGVKPMIHGIVSDFTATKHILRSFLSKICKTMVFKPNVVALSRSRGFFSKFAEAFFEGEACALGIVAQFAHGFFKNFGMLMVY